jgi:hypothetical protein
MPTYLPYFWGSPLQEPHLFFIWPKCIFWRNIFSWGHFNSGLKYLYTVLTAGSDWFWIAVEHGQDISSRRKLLIWGKILQSISKQAKYL